MSQISAQPTTRRDARKKNKRRPLVAFALATLAVGGVGAALTSAAWTDNVFFAAQAEAATFDLQGSLDGTTWVQSDNKGSIQLVVPASQFAKLLPGETRTVNLNVKNVSTVSASLTSTVEWATGSTFTTNPTATVSGLAATLTPTGTSGETDQFALTITTPANWDVANKGKSGTVVITVSGTATA